MRGFITAYAVVMVVATAEGAECTKGSRTDQVLCMQEQYKKDTFLRRDEAARNVAREWVRRFLDPDRPDFTIELQVAERQRKTFALIIRRCSPFISPPDAPKLDRCLRDQEEIEKRLGNSMQ